MNVCHLQNRNRPTSVFYWLAPECEDKNVYNEQTDVFAFGVLLQKLLDTRM